MVRSVVLSLILALLCGGCLAGAADSGLPTEELPVDTDCVILLHGLGRTHRSMGNMAEALMKQGYRVINLPYPSTDEPIETLASDHLAPAVQRCQDAGCRVLHMVSHSLGGILIRQYLQDYKIPDGSRIVMLSPPNQGSELADALKDYHLYHWITGPAGQQLGTKKESVPKRLAPVDGSIGVIAGNASWNPLFSYLIPGPDDGKVAVANARLEEMADFLVVPAGHTFIMDDDEVIAQTIHFLKYGRFDHVHGGTEDENPAGSSPDNR